MLGFIIAVVAGFLTPYAEAPLARPVARFLGDRIKVEDSEMRALAFMIVMLGAGIGAAVLQSGMTFWVILGGMIGYFGTRIVAALREMIEARRSN
jgi:hypothetical protein